MRPPLAPPKTQLSAATADVVAKALAGLKKTPVKDGPNSQGLSEQTRTEAGKVAAEGLRKPSPNLYQEVKIDELSNDSPSFSSPAESKVIEPTPRRYELPKPAEVLSSQTLDIIKKLRQRRQ